MGGYGFFKIPHNLRSTYARSRPNEFGGTPPPNATIPGNARGPRMRATRSNKSDSGINKSDRGVLIWLRASSVI